MEIIDMIAAYFNPKKERREWYLRDNVIITVNHQKK